MIDYLELFKPFHIAGKLCGVLPFTLHSYIECKIGHSRNKHGALDAAVKLFPAAEVACNFLVFAVLPLLAAAWSAFRMAQFGLLTPGMNNLDGLIAGAGIFLTILLIAWNGISRRKLIDSYATLLMDLHKRSKESILLDKITPLDLKPTRWTAWKILIAFMVMTINIWVLMACVVGTALDGYPFQFFVSGDPLLDILSIAGTAITGVTPVWIMAAFMLQSASAATFTRIKVEKLEGYLRAKLLPTNCKKNASKHEIDHEKEVWKDRPRIWSSNLMRTSVVTPETGTGTKNKTKDELLFRGSHAEGQRLLVVLAEVNRELRLIEEDHRMMSGVIKAEESLSITIAVGFLVFSGYYFWAGLNDSMADPSALVNWVKACDALLMTATGLFVIWTLCEEGYQLEDQTRKIARFLRRYQQEASPSLSWEDTFMLEQICNSLLESPLKYELGQLFILDRSTFATIFATILTNLIVLVQLKTPPTSSSVDDPHQPTTIPTTTLPSSIAASSPPALNESNTQTIGY